MFRISGCGKVTPSRFNPDSVIAPFRGQFSGINTAVLEPQMVVVSRNEA